MSSPVRRVTATRITDSLAHHGEGPVWSERWGGLRFVDMTAGKLLTYRGPSQHVEEIQVDSPVAAFVRPRSSGGYVVAVERGIGLADRCDRAPTQYLMFWDADGTRMNDGTVDPTGRLLAGSMAYDGERPVGKVFAVAKDHQHTVCLRGVTVSNGIGFSPEGDRMYYIDSVTRRVDVFDFSGGRAGNRRPFVEIETDAGLPDGLSVDSDGGVWVALWGGSAVRGYTADGRLTCVVDVPVGQVSACTFGGEDLRTLFITTSRQGLEPGAEPAAGSLFAADVGAAGLPEREFSG